MAKNTGTGKGRLGAVTGRSQSRNPSTGLWAKRDAANGRFMDVKKSGGSFKGVKREN
jgi:hypothetical protein